MDIFWPFLGPMLGLLREMQDVGNNEQENVNLRKGTLQRLDCQDDAAQFRSCG